MTVEFYAAVLVLFLVLLAALHWPGHLTWWWAVPSAIILTVIIVVVGLMWVIAHSDLDIG